MAWPIKAIKRELKNNLGGFSETQVLVRDCTSNVAEPVGDIPLRKITWAVCEDEASYRDALDMLFKRITDVDFPCHQTRALLVLYHLLFYMDPPNEAVVKQLSLDCREPFRFEALKHIACMTDGGSFPREFASRAHRKKIAKTILRALLKDRSAQGGQSPSKEEKKEAVVPANGTREDAVKIQVQPRHSNPTNGGTRSGTSKDRRKSTDEKKRAAQFAQDMAAIAMRESAASESLFDLSIFSEAFQDALWNSAPTPTSCSPNLVPLSPSTSSQSCMPVLSVNSLSPRSITGSSESPAFCPPVTPTYASASSSTVKPSSFSLPSSSCSASSRPSSSSCSSSSASSSSSSCSSSSSTSACSSYSAAEQQLFMSFLEPSKSSSKSMFSLADVSAETVFSLPPLSHSQSFSGHSRQPIQSDPFDLNSFSHPANMHVQSQTSSQPNSLQPLHTTSTLPRSSSTPPVVSLHPPLASSVTSLTLQPTRRVSQPTFKPPPPGGLPPGYDLKPLHPPSTSSSKSLALAPSQTTFKPPPPSGLPPVHDQKLRAKLDARGDHKTNELATTTFLAAPTTNPQRNTSRIRSLAVPSTPGKSAVQVWGCHVCQNINHFSMRACSLCLTKRDADRGTSVRDTSWMGETSSPRDPEKRKMQREKITQELFETEKSYVANIRTLLTVVADRLAQQGPRLLVSPEQQTAIFGNLRAIAQLHTLLFADLQSEQDPIKVFFKYMDFFKIYSQYLNNYDNAIEMIKKLKTTNPKFVAFLNESRSGLNDMDMESYLIMPVQRVPRYVLLLKELVRSTPTDDPKRGASEKALAKVEKIALYVNDAMKERQIQCHLLDVEQRMHGQVLLVGRRFVREAPCYVVRVDEKGHKERKQRVAFLFSNYLMLTKDPSYNLKHMLPLKQYCLLDDPSKLLDRVDQHVGVVLSLVDDSSQTTTKKPKETTFGLVLETFEEKEAWRRALKEEITRATPLSCQE